MSFVPKESDTVRYQIAAKRVNSTIGMVASLVASKKVSGDRSKKMVSMSSLIAYLETRNK